jgi:hypothetical protein
MFDGMAPPLAVEFGQYPFASHRTVASHHEGNSNDHSSE